jgi:outer membrane protein assembly factor BamB
MQRRKEMGVVLAVVLLVSSLAGAADWPQFRGVHRDGISSETGLLKEWPAGGPKELWFYEGLGAGFSSIAVADGMVYTTGMIDGQGNLFAFDLDGNLKYQVAYGPEWTDKRAYPGVRTTPTIDGDRLYLMSGQGRIACYKAKTGDRIWYVDTLNEYKGKNIRWGIAESVLIDGQKAICSPGGKNASLVALDKMTGKKIWTSTGLSEPSAYCSPMLIERGGTRLILTLVEKSIVGIDADKGTVYWKVPHEVSYDIQAVSPAYEDGVMYITNGYGKGSHGFSLSADGTRIEKKWSEKSLDVHHGGVVLVDGHIHGASNKGQWTRLEIATGKVKFTDKLVGKGSVIYADGMLYGYGERKGPVGLIKVTSDGYKMVSSFNITRGSKEHWAHPAISDGRLYLRHGGVLMCFDIKAK